MSHRSLPPSASQPGALNTASLLRMMSRPTPASTPAVTAGSPRPNGVYTSDAPPGYVALSVYLRGVRVIKLEIAEEYYSAKWFRFLQLFVHRNAPASLKLVD